MKKTISLILALAMVCSLALTGCGSKDTTDPNGSTPSADVVTLSCATKMTEDSFEGKTFQHFADLAKEYSNGTLNIVIYPSEQLGDSTTVVNNMQLGTVDMYIEGSTFYAGYGVDVAFTSSPFLMTEYSEYLDLVTGEFGDLQMQQMEKAGFKMLSTERNWIRGPYYVTCSTKPINDLADMQKTKFRSADSQAFMAAFADLGVSTMVINYSDCYMALNQGTVEAVNCPISNVESMKFYEVGPYVTYMNCYPQELWPVMNLSKFESLTAKKKDALIRAANDTATYSNAELDKYVEDMIARVEAEGATFNMDFDCGALQEALKGYYTEAAARGEIPELVAKFLGLL